MGCAGCVGCWLATAAVSGSVRLVSSCSGCLGCLGCLGLKFDRCSRPRACFVKLLRCSRPCACFVQLIRRFPFSAAQVWGSGGSIGNTIFDQKSIKILMKIQHDFWMVFCPVLGAILAPLGHPNRHQIDLSSVQDGFQTVIFEKT